MAGGRPKKFNSPEDLQDKVDAYFEECDMNGKPYTMSGLALALDIDRKTLVNYSKDEKFFPTIKKARQKVETYLEESLQTGSVAGVIFNLKNNFGWKDKTEVESRNTHHMINDSDWWDEQ